MDLERIVNVKQQIKQGERMPECKICKRTGVMTIEDLCCNCFDEVDAKKTLSNIGKGVEK